MPHSDLLLRGARRTAQPLPRPAPTLPPPSGHPHIGAEGMFLLGCYLPVIADGRLSPWGCGTPLLIAPSDSSAGKESACNAGDPGSIPGLGRSAGEGIGYPLQYSWASLVAQLVKNLPAMREDLGSIPGLGRSPGEGKDYPLQYSGLGCKEWDMTERLSLSYL